MSEIIIHHDENFERALRRFKHRDHGKPGERLERRASSASGKAPRSRSVR